MIPRDTKKAIVLWLRTRPSQNDDGMYVRLGPGTEKLVDEIESGKWRRDLRALRDALAWWKRARDGATIPDKHDMALRSVIRTVSEYDYFDIVLTPLGERLLKKVK